MNKPKAAFLVGIAGSLPLIASAPAHAMMSPTGPYTKCANFYNYTDLLVNFACQQGDKVYYDFKLPKMSNNVNPWVAAVFSMPQAQTHTFQATGLMNAVRTPTNLTPLTLTYSYKVKIDPLGARYEAIQTAATIGKQNMMSPVNSNYTGDLKMTPIDAMGNPTGAPFGTSTYTAPNSSGSSIMFPSNYDGDLLFEGQITLGVNSLLTQFTDTITQTAVPGPLPVVGAAAAFGFSRKLRKRVKASA